MSTNVNILIAGGSGFLGKGLTAALLEQGHQVTIITREPDKAATNAHLFALRLEDLRAIDRFDAVINLTGAGIADKRWSEARKRELLDSRIETTRKLVDWMAYAEQRPRVFLSGSAIGWYGMQGETALTEQSRSEPGFVHTLCESWEAEARRAETLGIRTLYLRTGVVLDPSGGMLAKILPQYRLGLGGRLGSGEQWMSWISRDDWVHAAIWLLEDETASGVYNLTAPNPVRNREFNSQLAHALSRPAVIPAPAMALKLAFGEMGTLLLDSQRVLPERLEAAGFHFEDRDLTHALQRMFR